MADDIQMQYLGLAQASPAPANNRDFGGRNSLNSVQSLQVRSQSMILSITRKQCRFSLDMIEKGKLPPDYKCSVCITAFELND